MAEKIKAHSDLAVYRLAVEAAMEIFAKTQEFPREETYSLTDQVRLSSRSVCANLAEAWRKRRYRAAFVSRLSDAETEAAETQVWIEFAVRSGYLERTTGAEIFRLYDRIIATIVGMIRHCDRWTIG